MTLYDTWKTTLPCEPTMSRCPWCLSETSEVIIDAYREVCGCGNCVEAEDAEGRICPICGDSADEYYYRGDDLIGCDRCVGEFDAGSTQTRGSLMLRGHEAYEAYIALVKAGLKVRLEEDE